METSRPSPSDGASDQISRWLERAREGDADARNELIRHACDRLRLLAQTMLRRFPGVRRWSDTDDVLQSALVRLGRALDAVAPTDSQAFFALAATQIRRELLDLARHYFGPEGMGKHHASDPGGRSDGPKFDPADLSHEPSRLAQWCEVHTLIGTLTEEQRQVFDLLFYQGMTQDAAAEVLGVNVRTVQRRWYGALAQLHAKLGELGMPE